VVLVRIVWILVAVHFIFILDLTKTIFEHNHV